MGDFNGDRSFTTESRSDAEWLLGVIIAMSGFAEFMNSPESSALYEAIKKRARG